MNARKPTAVPEEARSDEQLVELGPEDEDETKLERAIVEADEAERQGTLVPLEMYFAERRHRVGESVRRRSRPVGLREGPL